jgi:hypothetical protein
VSFHSFPMNINVYNICSAFNSTLINGKGRYIGGPQDVPLAIVNVVHGKRSVLGLASELNTSNCCYNSYRFRLVSISCDPSFLFSIDKHTMTVIEVEGTNVQPLPIDGVELFAGTPGSNLIICPINQTRNRTTLLRCCETLLSISTGLRALRVYRSLRTSQCPTTVCFLSDISRSELT